MNISDSVSIPYISIPVCHSKYSSLSAYNTIIVPMLHIVVAVHTSPHTKRIPLVEWVYHDCSPQEDKLGNNLQ